MAPRRHGARGRRYAAFVANSLAFLLIGMHEAHQNFVAIWVSAVVAIVLVTLGRVVAIYPAAFCFHDLPGAFR